jgi:hypothetical protein
VVFRVIAAGLQPSLSHDLPLPREEPESKPAACRRDGSRMPVRTRTGG